MIGSIEVLFVEDSDGADALDFLYPLGKHANPYKPLRILLDLNLPGTNGPEVLGEIKINSSLKRNLRPDAEHSTLLTAVIRATGNLVEGRRDTRTGHVASARPRPGTWYSSAAIIS